MNALRSVYLLFPTKLAEKPSMIFWSKEDAQAVCDALNVHLNEDDVFAYRVESMPLIGREY